MVKENKEERNDDITIKNVFRYHLFYWNWKLITESTVDKDKS